MQHAIISYYDAATGIVATKTSISAEMISIADLQSPMPSLIAISADSEPGQSYVKDGVVLPLPQRPSLHHAWDLAAEAWVDPRSAEEIAVDDEAAMDALRATATLSRAQFCLAVKRLGLLTAEEAKAAAMGEWPQAFADALSALPGTIDADDAQIVWASVSTIYRRDPVLAAVAATQGISDAQLDGIFGLV